MRPQIIAEDATYTFSDYFKLNVDTEDISTHFGYTFQVQNCSFPKADIEPSHIHSLKKRIEDGLPYVSLTSEMARREFLIAPVLWEVVRYTRAKLRVEYAIEVNQQLKGTLDYYLQGKNSLLVVEAKNADPQRGFTQLAVELIALDQWVESDVNILYGAISLGDMWRFGFLERQEKRIVQDFNLYPVPSDLENIIRIIVGMVK